MLKITLTSFIFILPTISLHVLLPLYLYPGDNAEAWEPIFSTISTHTQVQFDVVVNPNSGPGTTGAPTDANIIAGIQKLNSYPNVQTMGYVLTGHGSRAMHDITNDVDTYASWGSDDSNLHIGGIYFDEVSSETTSTMYSFYQSAAEHARSSISGARIAFNPGTIAPTQYFDYCDTMVEFEASLSDYQSQNPVQKIPEQYHEKTGFQIYSTPADTDVSPIVQAAAGEGVGAIFFGVDCCYKVWDAGLLNAMADAVSGAGGAASSEPAANPPPSNATLFSSRTPNFNLRRKWSK
ncbi:MAG: hypothetical protein Q9191_002287 [Dirinaria sp. TL-2023a]